MSKTGEMLLWAAVATMLAATPQPTREFSPSTKKDKKTIKRRKRNKMAKQSRRRNKK